MRSGPVPAVDPADSAATAHPVPTAPTSRTAPGPVAAGPRSGRAGAGPTVRASWPRRLTTVVARVRRTLSPTVVDVIFAGALFVLLSAAERWEIGAEPWRVLPVQIGLIVPLVWRRRAPELVFGCMAAAAFAQWSAGLRLPADVTLLVALYTVAAYRGRRATLLAFGALESGILLATASWSADGQGTTSFVSLSAMTVAATVIGTNMRGRREQLAVLKDRAVRLERERDTQARLAVAGERARIAREMHDIVTHNLSVMVALADGAVFAQERAPERATAAMRQVSATGRQAITDMRRFLGVLRADERDALLHPMPGIAQLDALAGQVRAAGLPTRLEVSGEPSAAPAAAQLTVYRLVQEALTNTLKHAPAGARADVRVACAPDTLTVIVTDDGAGAAAAPPDPARAPGHGLPGMRERAAAYGGRLTAGPLPAGGWHVSAVLALTPPEVP